MKEIVDLSVTGHKDIGPPETSRYLQEIAEAATSVLRQPAAGQPEVSQLVQLVVGLIEREKAKSDHRLARVMRNVEKDLQQTLHTVQESFSQLTRDNRQLEHQLQYQVALLDVEYLRMCV
eukprot:GHVQ01039287.1.p1 GENE.GHVQ01039287.1~~GHVQ01039287.1.p1  ORF type:complete len:120 (+),score=10.64 GHVQ01039287.1:737-1096(+)